MIDVFPAHLCSVCSNGIIKVVIWNCTGLCVLVDIPAGLKPAILQSPNSFTPSKEQLSEQFGNSVHLSVAGVHAFVFIVLYGRFTEQEEEILKRVQKVFCKDVLKHVIILFTYGDECDRENMPAEIDENPVVKRVIDKRQNYHVLNNRDLTDREQVNDLLLKIDTMIEQNGYYTNEMYEWAQMLPWEKFWKKLKQYFVAVIDYLWKKKKKKKRKCLMSFEKC
ncbi:GTPase IMAP family member 6-like [Ctenopharyngodon idella]|uniref:GTPase IMAP family member 6-like n=1 Tax=Ctenopharyngodon idella TaxID=7959 RepID=UPI00222FB96A|nr:GTPase IMAP family member 6-like [Ctenopharyngodon idella]